MAILTLPLAAVAAGDDFQPDPSHAPPPPPNPPPRATAFKPRPKPVSTVAPKYPERARRFNAGGTALLMVNVRADGRVEEVTADANACSPPYADNAIRAVRKWRFEPRDEPSQFRLALAMRPDDVDFDFDAAIRPMTSTPRGATDVKGTLTVGFAYVRLMIDASGKVIDRMPLSCEPEEFLASANGVIDSLQFAPAPQGHSIRGNATVNEFLIDYTSDGRLRVKQRDGS